MYKFSSVQLYLSRVIQTGQQESGADGSDEVEFPSIEDESGMGSGPRAIDSGATDSQGVKSREGAFGEDASGEDASGEDASGEDASGQEGSGSGEGMSSLFFTNLL